jgi:hypothetical protein
MKTAILVATLSALTLGACASAAPPSERLVNAEAAIRGALEVDAGKVPRAGLHLKLAQEQVDKAKRYMQDDQNERAALALRRAQADAELAIALKREHDLSEDAQAAQAKVEKLRAGKPL